MAANAGALAIPPRRSLDGADKVAALLLAMGKPAAGRLLNRFNAAELREITRAVAELGPLPASDVEALIEEFAGEFTAGISLLGTAHEVEQLLTGILPPEQISNIMSDVLKQNDGSVWERASEVANAPLVAFLSREHPQTVAYVLSKVSSACAAKVIAELPEGLRNGLMRRMATLRPVTSPVARLVEEGLSKALLTTLAKDPTGDANSRVAEILNRLEHGQIDTILENLAEARPEAAKTLKAMLFRFEDIVKLSPKSRLALFDQISAEQVVPALRGMDAAFRELILSSMASRARRMVEHELDSSDEPNPRVVADARRLIANRALELAARGEIELNDSEKAAA